MFFLAYFQIIWTGNVVHWEFYHKLNFLINDFDWITDYVLWQIYLLFFIRFSYTLVLLKKSAALGKQVVLSEPITRHRNTCLRELSMSLCRSKQRAQHGIFVSHLFESKRLSLLVRKDTCRRLVFEFSSSVLIFHIFSIFMYTRLTNEVDKWIFGDNNRLLYCFSISLVITKCVSENRIIINSSSDWLKRRNWRKWILQIFSSIT